MIMNGQRDTFTTWRAASMSDNKIHFCSSHGAIFIFKRVGTLSGEVTLPFLISASFLNGSQLIQE